MGHRIIDPATQITLAAIEKGLIIMPAKGSMPAHEVSDYNEKRAKEIGDFFKRIAKDVNAVYNQDFEIRD